MRRPINTVNGTYKDPNRMYSAQDALNVIPIMAEKGGTRTVSKYVDAPGLKPFCRIGQNGGEAGFVAAGAGRGLRVVDGKLYAVAGRNLWQITSAGVSVNYGTIPGVGRVSMAHNQRGLGNELAIDNGQSRYVFNTQTQDLQKVTDESFPGSIKAFFIDGSIGYIDPQGRYWGHSDVADALSYLSLNRYFAEGQPDRIVTAHVAAREVFIFGDQTTEIYVKAPSADGIAPFERGTNTYLQVGCSARDSVCSVGKVDVFLDQSRTVQLLDGYTTIPISTAVIDSALQACTKQQIANAYAFALESEGFQIYYLTVPGKFTFGYDFKNREWHRRSSTGLDWWAVTDVVQWNGRWFALDSRRGDILELRWYDYPFDVQEELVREWVTGSISADQNPIFVHELELLFGCGGQAYTTVDFPDQPLGPAISGTAPNGSIGIAYPGHTYTVTPGDVPIARTILRPGSTDLVSLGLSWDQSTATINAGVPTRNATVTLKLRTFDTSGLYADHEDTFDIQAILIAIGQIGEGSYRTLSVPDSTDWSETPVFAPTLSGGIGYALGIPGRGLIWGVSQLAYTDNYGTSWTVSSADIGGSGGQRAGCFRADSGIELTLIAGGLNGIYKSFDGGETVELTAYPTHPRTGYCGWVGDRLLVCSSNYSTFHYSDSTLAEWQTDLETFTVGGTLGTDVNTGAMACFDGICIVGGRETSGSGKPKLAITQDGVSVTNKVLSLAADGAATAIAVGIVDGEEIWVVGTSTGELLWSDDRFSTYSLATGGMAVGVTCGIFDGIRFVFAGASTGHEAAHSLTGKAFSTAPEPFTTSINCLLKITNE